MQRWLKKCTFAISNGRAINKLFHEIEKYKIKNCIIYLPKNQASSLSIHGGEKIRARFYRALTMQTLI